MSDETSLPPFSQAERELVQRVTYDGTAPKRFSINGIEVDLSRGDEVRVVDGKVLVNGVDVAAVLDRPALDAGALVQGAKLHELGEIIGGLAVQLVAMRRIIALCERRKFVPPELLEALIVIADIDPMRGVRAQAPPSEQVTEPNPPEAT